MAESDIMEFLFNYSGVNKIRVRIYSGNQILSQCREEKDRMIKKQQFLESQLQYYLSQIKDIDKLETLYQEKNAYEYSKIKIEGVQLSG